MRNLKVVELNKVAGGTCYCDTFTSSTSANPGYDGSVQIMTVEASFQYLDQKQNVDQNRQRGIEIYGCKKWCCGRYRGIQWMQNVTDVEDMYHMNSWYIC